MRQRSPICHFVLMFGTWYALFALPWPGLPEGYSAAYRYVANAVFDPFGDRGRVSFEPAAHPNRTADTVISTKLRGSPYIGDAGHSPRITGYLPTVEFIALALATPVTWRRRMIGMGIGVALIHAFIAVRVWIALLYWFSTPDTPWRLYELSGGSRRMLTLLQESVNVAPVVTFAFPAVVWLALLFRVNDWGGAFLFDLSEAPRTRKDRDISSTTPGESAGRK